MIQQTTAPFWARNRVQEAPSLCVTSVERLPKPPLRSILTYGAFDGFHAGHARWLGQLSLLGSDLVVGCATDAFCDQMGQSSTASFDARRAVLESCRFVSRVIALESWDQRLTDIVNYNISIFAVRNGMGPELDALSDIVQVMHLPSDLPPTRVEPLARSA